MGTSSCPVSSPAKGTAGGSRLTAAPAFLSHPALLPVRGKVLLGQIIPLFDGNAALLLRIRFSGSHRGEAYLGKHRHGFLSLKIVQEFLGRFPMGRRLKHRGRVDDLAAHLGGRAVPPRSGPALNASVQ